MRTKNSIRNLLTAWIGQFALVLVKFFARQIFARYLSAEYLGFDAVIANIIGLLGLAELGVSSAIGFSLYKPLADENEELVKAYMNFYKQFYQKLAAFMLLIGVIVTPLLVLVIPEAASLQGARFVFALYILETVVSYLFGYVGTISVANQENHINLRNHYMFAVAMNIGLIIFLPITKSYVFYVAVTVLFNIAEQLVLALIVRKRYPLLRDLKGYDLDPENKSKLWENIKQFFIGNVVGKISMSVDSIILTYAVSLAAAGLYDNYMLVTNSVTAIAAQFMLAMNASVGNLVAKESEEKKLEVFDETLVLNSALYIISSACICSLYQRFISIWVGPKYLFGDQIMYVFVLNYLIYGLRGQINIFRNGAALYQVEARKSTVEAFINIGMSIVLGYFLGVKGILLGTFIAYIAGGIWECKILSEYLNYSLKKLLGMEAKAIFCAVTTMFLSFKLVYMLPGNWYIFFPTAVVFSVVFGMIGTWITFGRSEGFGNVVKLVKQISNMH